MDLFPWQEEIRFSCLLAHQLWEAACNYGLQAPLFTSFLLFLWDFQKFYAMMNNTEIFITF